MVDDLSYAAYRQARRALDLPEEDDCDSGQWYDATEGRRLNVMKHLWSIIAARYPVDAQNDPAWGTW